MRKYLSILYLLTSLCALAQKNDTLPDSVKYIAESTLHLTLKETQDGQLAALIFPNPITNRINLKFELKNIKSVTLDIEDMKGTVLLHENIYNLQDGDIRIIDVALFQDGLYILRLNSFNYIFSKRIIKISD